MRGLEVCGGLGGGMGSGDGVDRGFDGFMGGIGVLMGLWGFEVWGGVF